LGAAGEGEEGCVGDVRSPAYQIDTKTAHPDGCAVVKMAQ
jgi:hypothetical protein